MLFVRAENKDVFKNLCLPLSACRPVAFLDLSQFPSLTIYLIKPSVKEDF